MIQNRTHLERSTKHVVALNCIEEAIQAAAPETATRSAIELTDQTLSITGTDYNLDVYDEIIVVGGGKAASGVTHALESVLGEQITKGLILTKVPANTTFVRTVVGDHPVPSRRNVDVTNSLLEFVDAADEKTLILFVLTGGASALLTCPAADLTLSDVQTTTEQLLKGGVPIDEINAVRKHLSSIKGGKLARRSSPASVVGLMLSDVVGNDPSTIGSGPTVPDRTTYADALAVFDRYDIGLPNMIGNHLRSGVEGRFSETPFPGNSVFETVENNLIGDNSTALDAARSVADNAGYETLLLSSRLRGEAREIAKTFVSVGEEIIASGMPVEPPAVILGGGESTVTIADEGGEGGPNQELVLSGALELNDPQVIAAADTDGEDGSSDVAGAIADDTMVAEIASAREHLLSNDAGTYLKEKEATIQTGPTGTNVNDIITMVVPEQKD